MPEREAPPASDASVTEAEPADMALKVTGTLETQASNEATIESAALGGSESTCNNYNAESSAEALGADREKTLEVADELVEKGSTALKENDYAEAADCFSRALEIRVSHFGELAVECLNTYYQYGRALLYKAQEEADPLVSVPKKDGETQQESEKEENTKNATNSESSVASVSCKAELDENSTAQEGATETDGNEEEEGNNSDDAGEDDSDLDLAWKMLDVARVISEKQLGDTMEKVGILSALAEVALEREDIESSLGDYQKALGILHRIVEPDSRQIAELNFRICMCLELGSKPLEAMPYCQNAISICKSRMQRLANETNSSVSAASAVDDGNQQSSNGSETSRSGTDNEAEIKTLAGLCEDLEKKLEDLQQLASNPLSVLSEILGLTADRAGGREINAPPAVLTSSQISTVKSSGDLDPPTVSTAHSNGAAAAGVTHLGVVGRGVKRVHMTAVESTSVKKPATEPSSSKGDNRLPSDNP